LPPMCRMPLYAGDRRAAPSSRAAPFSRRLADTDTAVWRSPIIFSLIAAWTASCALLPPARPRARCRIYLPIRTAAWITTYYADACDKTAKRIRLTRRAARCLYAHTRWRPGPYEPFDAARLTPFTSCRTGLTCLRLPRADLTRCPHHRPDALMAWIVVARCYPCSFHHAIYTERDVLAIWHTAIA